ncbi:MAG: YciI family protein [Aggregatilineales bacterium]
MSQEFTPPELEKYYLVMLRAGDNAGDFTQEQLMDLQRGHLTHLGNLARQGNLIAAGPFIDAPDNLRGISILKANSVEEAQALVDADPAAQAGRIRMEVITWCVEKGALDPLVDALHARIQAEKDNA